MDVVAFPSHREGFPNVIIEASAAGRPGVGFRVTGMTDAIVDGDTGALVPPQNANALAAVVSAYLDKQSLRERRGKAGEAHVRPKFRQEDLWARSDTLFRTRLEHSLPRSGWSPTIDSRLRLRVRRWKAQVDDPGCWAWVKTDRLVLVRSDSNGQKQW